MRNATTTELLFNFKRVKYNRKLTFISVNVDKFMNNKLVQMMGKYTAD